MHPRTQPCVLLGHVGMVGGADRRGDGDCGALQPDRARGRAAAVQRLLARAVRGRVRTAVRKVRVRDDHLVAAGERLAHGQVQRGVPADSRFATNAAFFARSVKELETDEGRAKIDKVRKLTTIAERLGGNVSQLALAWCAANKNVSTVILGASRPQQVHDNCKALKLIPKLTPEVMQEIDAVLGNKPKATPSFGRRR